MTEGFYVHIAGDVWLGKGKPAPTLLASYFTLKLLTEHAAVSSCGRDVMLEPSQHQIVPTVWRLGQTQMPITNPLMFKLIVRKVTATYGRNPCTSSSGRQLLHHFAS